MGHFLRLQRKKIVIAHSRFVAVPQLGQGWTEALPPVVKIALFLSWCQPAEFEPERAFAPDNKPKESQINSL